MKIIKEGNGEERTTAPKCEVVKDSHGLTYCGDLDLLPDEEDVVIQVLKDVRAEIEAKMESIIGKYDSNTKPENMPSRKIERNNGRTEAIDIIDRKIAEVTRRIKRNER